MKESKFIEQNKKNWQDFESDLRYTQNKATRLSRLYIQVTDDLSYARTFYKNRSVRVYLNGIAQTLFNDLYRNQKGSLKGFTKFWKVDLPMQIHEARKEFRISFVAFFLALCIGLLSSAYDKDFARLILGNEYVNMTNENIKKHDPLAVFKNNNEAHMFVAITLNNLIVSLLTFIYGIILSIGTIVKLIYNGIMVGAFQYLFIERGLFKESFLTIWQHGTLEISGIIIAGAAGITLGKGLIFPGTFSRLEAFKMSALRGLKIFLGIVPVIIIAAFIESFFTRYTDVSDYLRLTVILLSLSFVMFYFVWYPWYVSNRQTAQTRKAEVLSFRESQSFNFSGILSGQTILGYALQFITQNTLWVILLIISISLSHGVLAVINEFMHSTFNPYGLLHSSFLFKTNRLYTHFILGIASLSLLQCLLCFKVDKLINKHPQVKTTTSVLKLILSSILASFVILLPFATGRFLGVTSLIIVTPFIMLNVFLGYQRNRFFVVVTNATLNLLKGSWGKMLWNSVQIFILIIFMYILINTPFVWSYIESIYFNINADPDIIDLIRMFVFTFLMAVLFSIYFVFQVSTSIMSAYAFNEIVYAENLLKRIEMVGERKKMFGFEKEI
jgi:uncharacterized membrane protein SpoIIM required for sporulation